MIVFFILSIVALSYAAYCSAVQDTVKHHFDDSIFYDPETTKTKFGFNRHWWFRSLGTNKWMLNENGEILIDPETGKRVPRLTGFWFIKFQAVQLYDAWHFYKMLKIGMNIIADVTASVLAVLIFIVLSPTILAWVIIAVSYFIIQAINWNYFFNNNYDDWLLRSDSKLKLEN
jgi:hypothetical protein